MNREKLIAEVTSDIQKWWGALDPIKRGPIEKYCLWWAAFTVVRLAEQGIHGDIQAGNASWIVVKDEDDDGVSPNDFKYEFHWTQLEAFETMSFGTLPEMHVWVVVPPESCPENRGQLIDFTTQFVLGIAKEAIPHANKAYPLLWLYFDEFSAIQGAVYEARPQATEIAEAIIRHHFIGEPLAFSVVEPFER